MLPTLSGRRLASRSRLCGRPSVARFVAAATIAAMCLARHAPAADDPRLTGDWFGLRPQLADRGWDFNLFNTQFYQGVALGGPDQRWDYGGKLDYLVNLDGQKSGLWQGFFVNMHAETRYGDAVNDNDGLLTPSNIAMSFPDPNAHVTSITGLKLTQAVSENLAFYAGKINTLQEYPLKYSPGLEGNLPGLAGFMNTSLVFNPIAGRTVPYSAAAVGAAFIAGGAPVATLTAFDPRERATEGMNDLYADGVTLVPDVILRSNWLGLPGIWNLGGTYSTANYRSVDPAAYLSVPPPLAGVSAPLESQSWALYSNTYQSLWFDPAGDRHWGLFGQFGISDGNPNPVQFVANGGVGGRSMLPGRTLDTFGVGYFYIGLSENFKNLTRPILPQTDERGVELFYNYAVTPWCRLTGDMQVVDPSTAIFNTAIITGLRLQMLF